MSTKIESVPTKPKKSVRKKKETPKSFPDQETVSVPDPETVSVPDQKSQPTNYYRLDNILKENADINIIMGERSNGKTYAIQEYLIKKFIDSGKQWVLVRRWLEDVKPTLIQNYLKAEIKDSLSDMSNGKFTGWEYRNGWFYLCSYDSNGKPRLDESNRMCYVGSVTESERLKSLDFNNVNDIVYEEFISLSLEGYHTNEITLFDNLISTIFRRRTDGKIWMLGNTINPYCPFFERYGIKADRMKSGTITSIYNPETDGKITIEFCKSINKGSLKGTHAKYFMWGKDSGTFDMIGKGLWQLPDVPLMKPNYGLIDYTIGLNFDGESYYVRLKHNSTGDRFVYVHQVPKNQHFNSNLLVLDLKYNVKNNYFVSFRTLPVNKVHTLMIDLINNSKVFFDNRFSGNVFRNFLTQSNHKISGL